MRMNLEQLKNYFQRPQVKQITIAIVLVLLGWFLRGWLSGGSSAGGFPGGMFGAGAVPQVVVQEIKSGPVKLARDFVGHVEAIQSVELKAQVSGYIQEVNFKEGALVNQGDLLFTIDQKQYVAEANLGEAVLAQAKASLVRSQKYYNRVQKADRRSVSEADLESAESDLLQAQAKVQQAQAALDLAKINLGFTEIVSPITGRIGQALFTKGNYVSPSSGLLAQIVQNDPIRVAFSMPDREYLTILKNAATDGKWPYTVRLRLADGKEHPGEGEIDFQDNQMNPETGTMTVRTRFVNSDGLLIPNSFVTVLLQQTNVATALLVPQEAVLETTDGSLVMTVGEDNKVVPKQVTLGERIGANQIVLEGLKGGEQVITRGLQKVHPGSSVVVKTS